MATSTRIYISGAFAFGGQPAVNDLLAAGYSTLIVWSVHVDAVGNLFLNDTQIVSNGVYKEAWPFNLPARLAQLRKAGAEIIFSVGAGETSDFTNIANLLGGKPGGPGNIIYKNFQALKQAMVAGGGDIDAIDFDNEDNMDASVMINFGITLANAGYKHVTFCPWTDQSIWYDTMKGLIASQGNQFVNAIHLQVYSGGSGNLNLVPDWIKGFKAVGSTAAMIPGLATNQSSPGPWWDGQQNVRGGSVITVPNVAMFEGANWDNFLYTQNFPNIDAALKGAQPPPLSHTDKRSQTRSVSSHLTATDYTDERGSVFIRVTNTPPLGAPATVAGASGFGSITSAGDPRVLQFGLKVNF